MSGIAGLVNLDGAPVNREILERMTRCLRPHGPDAEGTWIEGAVGLGHAMLRTTPESESERQPLTLDGDCWITADCRLDARDDLRRELIARGTPPASAAPDAALILHAYAAWGDACVEHFLGDFAFALWDARHRVLFCARDHFGVKPFYWAQAGRSLVFSNNLNAIRLHPAVPARLDDLAIADFLVFGSNLDADRTCFASVRRLPPAHGLLAGASPLAIRPYWRMTVEEELHYRRRGEYLERFRDLLATATRDRLRATRISVMMSGGLDSPSITAIAKRQLAESGEPFDICAHTIIFDRIASDEERQYSQIAADGIGIPIRHHPFDDFGFPPPEPEPDGYPPEPRLLFDWSRAIAVHRPAVAGARVLLRGDGADPLMIAAAAAPRALLQQGQLWRVAADYLWLTWARRQIPYFGLRTMARAAIGRPAPPRPGQPFPAWLAPDLQQRLDLQRRWRTDLDSETARPGFELTHGYWSAFLESVDPGSMGLPAEARYPYLDLRLVRWLLRVPQVPWAMEKSLLRLAMRGLLPSEILKRRKAPVAGNPWAKLLPPASTHWWRSCLTDARLADYVDVPAVSSALARLLPEVQARNDHGDIDRMRSLLRPVSLGLWLARAGRANLGAALPSVEVRS